ncbi:MAG: hypothetical protein AAF726_03080 [Planctomycetota bacterium]
MAGSKILASPLESVQPLLAHFALCTGAFAVQVEEVDRTVLTDAGTVYQFVIAMSGAGFEIGDVMLRISVGPSRVGQVLVGSRWVFQAWFRDAGPSGPTFQLSDGLEVAFTP